MIDKRIVYYSAINGEIKLGHPVEIVIPGLGPYVTGDVTHYDEETEIFETAFRLYAPS